MMSESWHQTPCDSAISLNVADYGYADAPITYSTFGSAAPAFTLRLSVDKEQVDTSRLNSVVAILAPPFLATVPWIVIL